MLITRIQGVRVVIGKVSMGGGSWTWGGEFRSDEGAPLWTPGTNGQHIYAVRLDRDIAVLLQKLNDLMDEAVAFREWRERRMVHEPQRRPTR